MRQLLNSVVRMWQDHLPYKFYVILLFLAFGKQMYHEARLIDGQEYMIAAHNMVQMGIPDSCVPGHSCCDHWLHETRRTVGYPLLIMITGFLVPLLLFFQCLLTLYLPVVAKKILNELGHGEKTFNYFLWLIVVYPLQFFYASLLMPEAICQFLLALSLWLFLKKKYGYLSLSISALILLKPVFIILMFVGILYAIFSIKKRWTLFLPLVIFICISWWNKTTTGVFHYSSIGVENAWEYNANGVLFDGPSPNVNIDSFNIVHYNALSWLNFKEKYEYLEKETGKIILSNWQMYFYLHVKGCILATIDPGRYDFAAFTELPKGIGFMIIKNNYANVPDFFYQPLHYFIYMMLFAIVNLMRWILVIVAFFSERKKLSLILLLIVLFIAITGPVGSARYLYPFMPWLCILAAIGWKKLREKRSANSIT